MIDLSYQYYRDEGKQLKRQRDFINRRTHPQVRKMVERELLM